MKADRLSTSSALVRQRRSLAPKNDQFNYDDILRGVLTKRNDGSDDIDSLKREADVARKRIEEELDRKIQLENEKHRELSDISGRKKKALEEIDFQVDEAGKEHNLERKRIFDELRDLRSLGIILRR